MKTALTAFTTSLRAYRFRPYAKAETAPCPSPPIKSDRTLGDSTSPDCTANVDASPSPASSLPSSSPSQSSVFQSSAASPASPVSPDVPLMGVMRGGLPAFHDASPTIVRSKDLARYLMALNRTHDAPFVVWDIAKSWGLEPNQLASFMNRYFDPRSCYDTLLSEPWRGRLVCIEDLLAWERHVAKWAQRQWNAAMWPKTFSDEHGIDTLQFADIIRSKACGVITSWVRQGRSLIDANDVPGVLNVTPLERMAPPGVYWIKRTTRQPRPS